LDIKQEVMQYKHEKTVNHLHTSQRRGLKASNI